MALVADLLASNAVPSPTEASTLSQELAFSRKQLAVIESRISVLAREREKIQLDIAKRSTILSVIRQVPSDVLSDIFIACIDKNFGSGVRSKTTLDTRAPPWTLAQVCSRWRAVALSTPEIWATVRIIMSAKHNSHIDNDHSSEDLILGVQLYRSSNHPLSISIYSPVDISASNSIFQILRPTSPRWQALCLLSPSSFSAFSDIKGFLPSLATLYLHQARSGAIPISQVAPLSLSGVLEFAPKLQTLRASPTFPDLCHISLGNIRFYSSQFPTDKYFYPVSAILRLLRHLGSVESCILFCGPEDQQVPYLPLELPHLSNLTIRDRPGSRSGFDLLKSLSVPALKRLNLFTDHIHVQGLQSLTNRSTPSVQLQHLTIQAPVLNEDAYERLLNIWPTLLSLRVEGPADLVVSILARPGNMLAPSLQVVTEKQSRIPGIRVFEKFRQTRQG